MTYCGECKGRLTENPEIGWYDFRHKRYYAPLCQGCSHEGDKDMDTLEDRLNRLESKVTIETPWDKKQWYAVAQLKGELANIKRHFIELEKLVTTKGYKPKYK